MQFLQHIISSGGLSGLSIQSGEIVIPNGSYEVQDSIVPVTLNKSLLFFTYKHESINDDPFFTWVRGRLENSSTLEFTCNFGSNTNADITIKWYVLEFSALSPVTVQRGTMTMTGTVTNIGLSPVDLAHSFPVITSSNATANIEEECLVGAEITSSNNLQLRSAAINTTRVEWQVIENMDWDVSKYVDSMVASDTFEGTPISPVSLSDTFFVLSTASTGFGSINGNQITRHYFNGTTQLAAFRPQTGGFDYQFIYYVVDTNGQVSVQHEDTDQINNGSDNNSTVISSVDVSKAIPLMATLAQSLGSNITDGDRDGETLFVLLDILNSTTLDQERGGATANILNYAYMILEFS